MAGVRKKLSVIIVILAGLILPYFLLRGIGAFLIVSDTLTEVDAVVALSGGDNDSRLDEAVRLFQEGYARWLVLTDTGGYVPRYEIAMQGIPPDLIVVSERVVSSTRDEAYVMRKLMKQRGWKSCIVVTDPYHSMRTRLIFRDAMSDIQADVRVRSVINSWYRSDTWWWSHRGWELTTSELIKMTAYLFGLRSD